MMINARALILEKDIKELDEKIAHYCDGLKYPCNDGVFETRIAAIRTLRDQAKIARNELRMYLEDAINNKSCVKQKSN